MDTRWMGGLSRSRSLGGDIERVQRLAGRHEQPIALGSAEGDVAAHLGQADATDELTFRRPHRHPAVAQIAAAIARDPEIAVHVTAGAVGSALDAVNHTVTEEPAVGDLVVAAHVEYMDVAVAPRVRVARSPPRADDVELLVVRREHEPVG